jgi:DNA-binding CsgD family transcriptional regulator
VPGPRDPARTPTATGRREALEAAARARQTRGDDARAGLRAAADAYGALDAVWRRERLLRLEGHRVRALPALGLTRRERDVTSLAVRGLTAREIGARLGIGHRTVETHLGSAYAKLGLRSRIELASRAVELGVDAAEL